MSISPDPLPPVWPTKPETDACYNESARFVIDAIAKDVAKSSTPSRTRSFSSILGFTKPEVLGSRVPTVGALFGTHNWTSCRLILDELVKRDLATTEGVTAEGESVVKIGSAVTERLTLAQLYGE